MTKSHLLGLARLLDTALGRGFLVLDRLGYGPFDPPLTAEELEVRDEAG
jgi:hypothetical protein